MRTILVAEDSEADVFFFKHSFRLAGIEANLQFVANGEAAMAYLRGEGRYADRGQFPFPDLTLLDIKMPRKDGFEVLEEVRSDPRIRRLPVVFYTASDDPQDVNRAFDSHANSYLIKSNNANALENVLQKVKDYWFFLNQNPTCPEGGCEPAGF